MRLVIDLCKLLEEICVKISVAQKLHLANALIEKYC